MIAAWGLGKLGDQSAIKAYVVRTVARVKKWNMDRYPNRLLDEVLQPLAAAGMT